MKYKFIQIYILHFTNQIYLFYYSLKQTKNLKKFYMKSEIKDVLVVLVALVLYELVVRKMLTKAATV